MNFSRGKGEAYDAFDRYYFNTQRLIIDYFLVSVKNGNIAKTVSNEMAASTTTCSELLRKDKENNSDHFLPLQMLRHTVTR